VVNPVATADNGITYGAIARLRANAGGANSGLIDGDKAYVYVSGTFGEVRGGVTYGPSDVTYVAHPQDWQLLGIYDQWRSYTGGAGSANASKFPTGYTATGSTTSAPGTTGAYAWGQFSNGAVATDGVQLLGSHNIDTKLVYYTPRLFGQTPTSGLQGGFSYAPRNGNAATGFLSVNTDVNRQLNNAPTTGVACTTAPAAAVPCGAASGSLQRAYFDDTYELTANYNETFNGVLVKASAGYAGGSAHNDGSPVAVGGIGGLGGAASTYHDLESFQFGAQIGYADFILGGGYVWGGQSGYTKAPWVSSNGVKGNSAAAVVAAGGTGVITRPQIKDQTAWNLGGQYTWGPWVFGVKYLEETDAGNLAYTGNRTLGAITGGTLYTVAPGLRVGAEYTHFDATSNVPTTAVAGAVTSSNGNDSGDVILVRTIVNW
jgi:outer membrane protein OmpU